MEIGNGMEIYSCFRKKVPAKSLMDNVHVEKHHSTFIFLKGLFPPGFFEWSQVRPQTTSEALEVYYFVVAEEVCISLGPLTSDNCFLLWVLKPCLKLSGLQQPQRSRRPSLTFYVKHDDLSIFIMIVQFYPFLSKLFTLVHDVDKALACAVRLTFSILFLKKVSWIFV